MTAKCTRQIAWTFISATLGLAISACGGGSGSEQTSTTSGGSTGSSSSGATGGTSGGNSAQLVPPTGTLLSNVAAPTYAASSNGASAFNALNAARQAAGAGVVSQSVALDISAQAHADYLITNLVAVGLSHNEDSSFAGYYAATPADRMTKAGFPVGYSTEVIGGSGISELGSDCMLGLLDTVYHGAGLLSEATVVGFGFDMDYGSLMCVGDAAAAADDPYSQVPASGNLVTYPYPGETGVFATFYVGDESPRAPSTLFPAETAGTPIIVRMRNADWVNRGALAAVVVNQFTLTDADGNTIPSAILASSAVPITGQGVTLNADANLSEGFVVLVPFSPLRVATTYQAAFKSTVAGVPANKTWTFTTQSAQ